MAFLFKDIGYDERWPLDTNCGWLTDEYIQELLDTYPRDNSYGVEGNLEVGEYEIRITRMIGHPTIEQVHQTIAEVDAMIETLSKTLE